MSPDRIERALVEVAREARTEPLPDVDWEAIEDELPMTRSRTVPPQPFHARPWLLAAAFVIGAGALGLAEGGHLEKTAAAPRSVVPAVVTPAPVSAADGDVNGDALVPGAHVTASDFARSVVHRAHARWTLAPHSEGTLLANGDVVTIRLDHGSVTSRVTKSSRTETFAVEAADVRVAAHGTEFMVSLGADGVSVSVTEGSVLVGPRSEVGTGQLLLSPSAKRYTLRGLPLEDDRGLDALGALRVGSTLEPAGTTASSAVPGAAPVALDGPSAKKASLRKPTLEPPVEEIEANQAPDEPSIDGLEGATASVLHLTKTCFKERTIAGEGVRVTAQTSVTFRTLPQGGVSRVVFDPPLSPAVQACVNAGMSAIPTDATKHGFQVSHGVDLER